MSTLQEAFKLLLAKRSKKQVSFGTKQQLLIGPYFYSMIYY